MKLHYKGKYSLDPDTLPHGEHIPGAVAFKEVANSKHMAVLANVLSFVIAIPFMFSVFYRCWEYVSGPPVMLACIASLLCLFPHELLHAVCFRGDVYLYTNFAQGMLFVVGPETMSKQRFIFMSLLPNIVLGFVPYVLGMIFPQLFYLAFFGALSSSMGAGDYYNVFNALTQMPRGSRTYLYKFNSFWYMPE